MSVEYSDTDIDKAYDQGFNDGKIDVIWAIKKFRNSLDKMSECKLMDACDIILEQIKE